MYFAEWALVLMGFGLMSLGSLIGIFIMSILVAGSQDDDQLLEGRQYDKL